MSAQGRHVPTSPSENYNIGPAGSATSAAIQFSLLVNGPDRECSKRSVIVER
jgi:hypothetical protein